MAGIHPAAKGTGLAPNIAGALSYLVGPITGIIFLVLEKESRFVRFHAAQSIVVSAACMIVGIALSVLNLVQVAVPVIGWLIGIALSLGTGAGFFVLWLMLMFVSFQGKEWEVPLVGVLARRLFLSVQP